MRQLLLPYKVMHQMKQTECGLNGKSFEPRHEKNPVCGFCIFVRLVSSLNLRTYCKVPKFSDARKLCCNLPKIQTKSPNLRVFCKKDANGIANSEDPDQTAPLGADQTALGAV